MQPLQTNITYQVMWNRLISIVEEQAQTLIRTAFSTSVREAGDLSAGVYNQEGKMLAQAVTGTPGHINAMADAVGHFMKEIGVHTMAADDVYITNNPWQGTGHLHDITIVTPSFYGGKFIGFFACTAHVVDIGGRGFGADAGSVYEEGLHIPIMRLISGGKVDKTLINIIRANVREPNQIIGDIYALVACNDIGNKRLNEMMVEYNLDNLQAIAQFILQNSFNSTLKRIASLPRESAVGAMIIDGYDTPVTLKVKIDITKDRIFCDFSGSSPVDKKGINVPLVYTKAYACYALRCAIAPDIPNNAASLAPFTIIVPPNCILNAVHPAPVALRHVIGHMLPDTIFNALDKILPHRVPAESTGMLCNFQLSLHKKSNWQQNAINHAEVLSFNSGGSGARPACDGLNTTAFPSGVMTMPIEATEHSGPALIWRKELRQDSGGAGQYRGGLGQYMTLSAQEGYEFEFQAMFDRMKYPPRGRHGGQNGAAMTIKQDSPIPMRSKGKYRIPYRQRVVLGFPGGGGYGAVKKRDKQAIYRDLAFGYISPTIAKKIYNLDESEIEQVLIAVKRGENF